jgi:hypothetical protein
MVVLVLVLVALSRAIRMAMINRTQQTGGTSAGAGAGSGHQQHGSGALGELSTPACVSLSLQQWLLKCLRQRMRCYQAAAPLKQSSHCLL